MTHVTNRWVAKEAKILFANSPAYNVEIDMAGRQKALRQLTAIAAGATESRCARVSDLLGAGKTFFLQNAVLDLQELGLVNETTDVAFVDYRVVLNQEKLDAIDARMLIVDELDRKALAEPLRRAIKAVA